MSNYIKQNRKEVREFLKSIDSDFYLDLYKYDHYADKDFYTDDLTITQMLQICESHLLRVSASKYVMNKLDIAKIMLLILQRVSDCDNKKLTETTKRTINKMDCYLSTVRENNILI